MKRNMMLCVLFVLAAAIPAMAADRAELKAAYEKAAAAAAPMAQDYALNWQAARAARLYGNFLVEEQSSGWKEIAREAAKTGMKYGEIACGLQPTGIEGWYWYGLSVATYADCVSILKALGEGLKAKTQKGFENAYAFDKNFDNCGPMLALGRFWQVLPPIAGQNRKKAEALFNEYIAAMGSKPEADSNAWYYRGELYKDMKRIPEARADLEKAASMGNKHAQKLLAEMK